MNGYYIAVTKLIYVCLHARDGLLSESFRSHPGTTLPYRKLDLRPGNKHRFKYVSAFMILESQQHA